jgi:hypothetical protein
MTRDQLAHVLRAAAAVVEDQEILVVGSQAILASYSEEDLPEVAWMSAEADLAFWDGDQSKPDVVDAFVGETSRFHETFGYYGQGVDLTTAKLPEGWRDRLVRFDVVSASPATATCLEPHDLVIAKLVAHREKDQNFAWALLQAGLVQIEVLHERAAMLTCVVPGVRRAVQEWLGSAEQRLRRQD